MTLAPDLPASRPSASARDLGVGRDQLSVAASQGGGRLETDVSGAQGLALTLGAVGRRPQGAGPHHAAPRSRLAPLSKK